MGRLPRVYIEGILYYITSRSGLNQKLFINDEDFKEYIGLIDKYKKQYDFKLFAYALLPTHLHMLIELRHDISISTIMHDINSLYTKLYNSRYSKRGHLFQERFKTSLAEKEVYLLKFTRHIHLNPKRIKLVDQAKDYQYSSYHQYIDPAKRLFPNLSQEIEEIFEMLKGRETEFDRYVSSPDEKELYDLRRQIRRRRILGSREFIQGVEKTIEDSIREQKRKPLPKKVRLTYVLLGSTAILAFAFFSIYFYRYQKQQAQITSDYQKTVSLYKTALEMLKQAKENDLKKNKDVTAYNWKIRLTEKALRDFQQQVEVEGYAWNIEFTQTSGPKIAYIKTDEIYFDGNRFMTKKLSIAEGFSNPYYSTTELENGNTGWDTIQTSPEGSTARWQGEWDGNIMRGTLERISPDGTVRGFSFVSRGERIEKE